MTDHSPETPVADVPKTGNAPEGDVLAVPTSASEVPAPVKEITQETSVADAPKTGEAGTTDDSPKTPVADVPKTGDV